MPGFRKGVTTVNGTTISRTTTKMTTDQNVRVSFKLSREAVIKLREIALTNGELLRGLGVLAVQLGNESQICISSPLNFNLENCKGSERVEKARDEGFDSELTDSLSEISEGDKVSEEEEGGLIVDRGVREVNEEVALATAASVKICVDDEPKLLESDANKASLTPNAYNNPTMNARSALYHEIHHRKSKEGRDTNEDERVDVSVVKNSQETTSTDAASVNNESNIKFDTAITTTNSNVSFAQHLINLSKQYRSENSKSPTTISNDKYAYKSRIVGSDHVLHCYNHDKTEDFMGLNVNNSLLFDSYGTTSVKSAEELSKEQSEMSPTNLDSMSVSSADSLFEEARLGSVDELRLSPSSVQSPHDHSHTNSSSPTESFSLEMASPSKRRGKPRRSVKIQKLLKSQTGIVCELCMRPVQKSYSCYQASYAPKEIMHLFQNGSSCVRVCRRCLPYKAPRGHQDTKVHHKKPKKMSDLLSR